MAAESYNRNYETGDHLLFRALGGEVEVEVIRNICTQTTTRYRLRVVRVLSTGFKKEGDEFVFVDDGGYTTEFEIGTGGKGEIVKRLPYSTGKVDKNYKPGDFLLFNLSGSTVKVEMLFRGQIKGNNVFSFRVLRVVPGEINLGAEIVLAEGDEIFLTESQIATATSGGVFKELLN